MLALSWLSSKRSIAFRPTSFSHEARIHKPSFPSLRVKSTRPVGSVWPGFDLLSYLSLITRSTAFSFAVRKPIVTFKMDESFAITLINILPGGGPLRSEHIAGRLRRDCILIVVIFLMIPSNPLNAAEDTLISA